MNSAAIIGAGKFASSFTSALQKSGIKIGCIISSNKLSAEELAHEAGIKLYSDQLSDIPDEVNVFFITVPDSEIKSVAYTLAALELDFRNIIAIHCSGALDSSVLEPLQIKGAATASFHVMQTFPSKHIVEIAASYASIETVDNSCAEFLFDLAQKLNLIPFRLDRKQKTAYHLSGVFASNFLIGNLFSASEVFPQSMNPLELLEPIIYSTLNNIKKNGAAQALSGPIDRGDLETIQKHISIISDKELLLSYISQSYILLRAAEQKYSGLTDNQKNIKYYLDKCIKECNLIRDRDQ